MFFLAADLAQQEYFSIFGYAEENLTLPEGEGMDSVISKTFAYLQPHDEPMRLLWIVTRCVTSLPLELLGSLSKLLQGMQHTLLPSKYLKCTMHARKGKNLCPEFTV